MRRPAVVTPGAAALELEQVSHRFGRILAIDRLDLAVAPGEVVCLLGPSGSGKTTALRLAAGLEIVQAGRIRVAGRIMADASRQVPPERRGIGLVFQDYALFPHLSVIDNVMFGVPRANGRNGRSRRARALETLERVGMSGFAAAWPHELSGGQQQRVALARALAPEPGVLLLDEPYAGLDARLRDQVRDEVLHLLTQSGAATLMVTHDSEEAMFMADRIAVMRAGRVVQAGKPADLYLRPDSAFIAAFFGEVNTMHGTVRDGCVETAIGRLPAGGLAGGTPVQVVIRPEGVRVTLASGPADLAGLAEARVMQARLLGRTSLVHMSIDGRDGQSQHLHARVPGVFLPPPDARVGIEVDRVHAFVFPRGSG